MFDQKEKFICTGLTVGFVGSAQDDGDATEGVLNGKVRLVYMYKSSECLNNKNFCGLFQREIRISRKPVVDEAQCVKLW